MKQPEPQAEPVIQKIVRRPTMLMTHFVNVADRRERGFTFSLKAQNKPVVDPIFKEISQLAKRAAQQMGQVKKNILTPAQRLHEAARTGDCVTIRQLVVQGVDLEARDEQGRTAMNIATQSGQQKVVATILAAREMRYLASLGELPETAFFKRFRRGTGTGG